MSEPLHETHVCRDCGAEITLPYTPDLALRQAIEALENESPNVAEARGWARHREAVLRVCARYFGSDGTLCATHNARFASDTATRCARALTKQDETEGAQG